MATLKGISGTIQIGTDDIGEVQSWNMSMSAEETDTSIINASAKRTETGAIEASGSISCYFDDTDTTGQEALWTAFQNNTSVALNMYTDADSTGTVYYSCSAVVTSLDIDNGGATGRVTRNFSWKATTAVTKNTVV